MLYLCCVCPWRQTNSDQVPGNLCQCQDLSHPTSQDIALQGATVPDLLRTSSSCGTMYTDAFAGTYIIQKLNSFAIEGAWFWQ